MNESNGKRGGGEIYLKKKQNSSLENTGRRSPRVAPRRLVPSAHHTAILLQNLDTGAKS